MKRCSTSVIMREMQMKLSWGKTFFYFMRLSVSASLWIHSVGKALGNRHSHTLLMVVDMIMNPLWRDISEYLPKLLVKMDNF